MARTLCLDFDGVIHSYASGWMGETVVADPPTPGAVAFIRAAVQRFRVVIHSSRLSSITGTEAVRAALLRWLREELPADEAYAVYEQISFSATKPPAHVTLDDRALTFTGTFPPLDEIERFRPWTQR